ncbi:MAG: TetR/AcrR family transcriptional regulator [Pseudomonadota bacterium]
MRDDAKSLRQEQIEQAAYVVLEDKGYAGASMLSIARKAKASNETLYRWYGDKQGLFKALVVRNASEVSAFLTEQTEPGRDAIEILSVLGPKLIDLLTGERAVALNRAAAADQTGELGAAISVAGREAVAPKIGQVLEAARTQGRLAFEETPRATELYLNLLIGDLQIRRVIGRLPPLSAEEAQSRAARALGQLSRLLAPE